MEISVVAKSSLRIKGKNAVLSVDSTQKTDSNAVLFLEKREGVAFSEGSEVVISGPGEYETGGIKITGIKSEFDTAYSMTVDSVSVNVGKLSTLSKLQTKLKEANILIVSCDDSSDASFLSGLATSAIIFYGDKATEAVKTLGQENVERMPKFVTTVDKLPAEVKTIILE